MAGTLGNLLHTVLDPILRVNPSLPVTEIQYLSEKPATDEKGAMLHARYQVRGISNEAPPTPTPGPAQHPPGVPVAAFRVALRPTKPSFANNWMLWTGAAVGTLRQAP